MMKDVWITLTGYQTVDEDTEQIKLEIGGRYGYKDGKSLIAYHESAPDERGKTLIKIEPEGKLILDRSGSTENRMTIEKGKRHCGLYRTQQGELFLGVYGVGCESDLGESGGQAVFEYELDVEGGVISKNRLEIKVKEV